MKLWLPSLRGDDASPSVDTLPASKVYTVSTKPAPEESKSVERADNKGQLILDATCTPADITYQTDSKLLNGAPEKEERSFAFPVF